jgi:hypothetical protein
MAKQIAWDTLRCAHQMKEGQKRCCLSHFGANDNRER